MKEQDTVSEDVLQRVRRRLREAEAAGQLQVPGGRPIDRAPVTVRPGGKTPAQIIDEERE